MRKVSSFKNRIRRLILKAFPVIIFLLFPFLFAKDVFSFEHPHYRIKAEVDVSKKTIVASQTVNFVNKTSSSIDEMYFHIYPNRYYTEKEKEFMQRFSGYFKVDVFPEGFTMADVGTGDFDLPLARIHRLQ